MLPRKAEVEQGNVGGTYVGVTSRRWCNACTYSHVVLFQQKRRMALLYAPEPLPAAALRISLDFTQLILFNFENFSLVGGTPRFAANQVTPGVAGHLAQPMPRPRYQLAREMLTLLADAFTHGAWLYAGCDKVDGDGIAAVR